MKIKRAENRTRAPLSRAGFSLVELLIALTILAIALLPVAYFYSKTVAAIGDQMKRSRALQLAEERMAEIKALPYDSLRTNNTPGEAYLQVWVAAGNNQTDLPFDPVYSTANPYLAYAPPYPSGAHTYAPVFYYSLPPLFDPYNPNMWGYNVDRPDPEYESIGFYSSLARTADGRTSDPRRLSAIDAVDATGLNRNGTPDRESAYGIYGRRTIIMDVLPSPVDDADGDTFLPDDPRDGGATALNPYPIGKGPANKFEARSKYGNRGKLVTVIVFWLKNNSQTGIVKFSDLNTIILKTFISANNRFTDLAPTSNLFTDNDMLIVTPPPP